MAGPWEKYGGTQQETGPWSKYQAPAVSAAPAAGTELAAPKRTVGEELRRQLGLTGRYIAEGAANTVGMVTNPISEGMRQLGLPVKDISQATTELLNMGGVPQPETGLEQVVGAASRGVSGAALPLGMAQRGTSLLASELAKNPLTQIGAAAGSAGAGEVANQADVGPLGQVAASLAGGYLGGRVGGNIGARIGTDAPRPAAPRRLTAEDIRAQASSRYAEAEQAGGVLKPETTDKYLNDIASIRPKDEVARQLGGRDFIAENADVFESMRGQPMTLERATAIDQRLTELLDAETILGKPTQNGRQILLAQQKLRSIIDNASPDDVVGGTQGFYALKDARRLWSRSAKLRDIEAIIQRASGMEQPATGIRTGFRTLLNNPNRLRGYSPQEVDAIRKASQTGIVGNLFRAFGSGLVPIGAGVAGAAGGPLGAGAAGLTGYGIQQASKAIGENMQMARANRVAELLAGSTPKQSDPQRLARLLGIAVGANQ